MVSNFYRAFFAALLYGFIVPRIRRHFFYRMGTIFFVKLNTPLCQQAIDGAYPFYDAIVRIHGRYRGFSA